jgi:hypothetical protein
MNRGYVKLWRKTMDNGIVRNPQLLQFWVWCLLKASHRKHTQMVGFQEVPLEPGQFIFGRRKAASELNLSEQSIRSCLKSLKINQQITIKVTNKYSIITIVNWDIYQQDDDNANQQNNQQSNRPATSNQPAINQQSTTNKNGKNGKNEKKTTYSSQPDGSDPPSEKPAAKSKSRKPDKLFADDSDQVRLANLLYTLILVKDPKAKKPKLQSWAEHIDLMLRLDKRTPGEIEAVIRFCQADDFWCSNILSTKKLREKFTALLAKMNGKSARPKLDRIAEHNLAVVSEFLSRGDD